MNKSILCKTKLLIIAATIFMLPVCSSAAIIYDFAGNCLAIFNNFGDGDCTGDATGVLTLSDTYVPGAAIAESSETAGELFISFEMYLPGALDLTISQSAYTIVAGTVDPFFFLPEPDPSEGPLPSMPDVGSFADIFIVNYADSSADPDDVGFLLDYGDFFDIGGSAAVGFWFTIVNDDEDGAFGDQGTWSLRASTNENGGAVSVPEPPTIALLSLGLVGVLGLTRRRKTA